MSKYQRIDCHSTLALSTLAANTVLAVNASADVAIDTGRVTSAEITYDIEDHTVGEGPLAVGLAHSDYTVAEILEFLQLATGFDRGDKGGQEIAKRLIRRVGTFTGGSDGEVLNDGKPIKTKLNWVLTEGKTVQAWIINLSSGALTTGTRYNVNGKLNFFND